MPAIPEARERWDNGGNRHGGDGTDARHRHQSAHLGVLGSSHSKLLREVGDPLVEPGDLLEQEPVDIPHALGQIGARTLDRRRSRPMGVSPAQ